VPTISDADFMAGLDSVISGTSIEEFTDNTIAGQQFALF
jgi:DNA polymerase III subunit epsilon